MLASKVSISKKFLRSTNLDADRLSQNALDGYVFPHSSVQVLTQLAEHHKQTKQAAFTWTGPYGSGKSSLAVAFSYLLSGDEKLQKSARQALGAKASTKITKALEHSPSTGWITISVTGSASRPQELLTKALASIRSTSGEEHKKTTSDEALIEDLLELSKDQANNGVILFVDEMGKFLENSVNGANDIYFFQQLAEAANRSNGQLILIGILHQAMQEYAGKMSRKFRDEWTKIQGRFVDLTVNASGEEQLAILGQAIQAKSPPESFHKITADVALEICRQQPATAPTIAELFTSCWPLHPITAALLGPISKRRFGQNQRSLFSFLQSAEPHGFQDFLSKSSEDALYLPSDLWAYLSANLEPAILASPDSHKWATAADAIERCETHFGEDAPEAKILKTIAVVEIFRDRSGPRPTLNLLSTPKLGVDRANIPAIIEALEDKSLIIFRKFVDAFGVFAGSDFDIEAAINETMQSVSADDYNLLKHVANIQPILAKRHYHTTGALRWFDVSLVAGSHLQDFAKSYSPSPGAIGTFILSIPNDEAESDELKRIGYQPQEESDRLKKIVGFPKNYLLINDLYKEVLAIDEVTKAYPSLVNDTVAVREIDARKSAAIDNLKREVHSAILDADWQVDGENEVKLSITGLSSLASDLADKLFPGAPIVHNELINRIKPSSNAVGAQNNLLKAMVVNNGESDLGIEGFPAEKGIMFSVLKVSKLYSTSTDGITGFNSPLESDDPSNFAPLWRATKDYLAAHESQSVKLTDIYKMWELPPFGLKPGLMPLIIVAFIQSNKNQIAFYRDGVFQPRFKDIDVEVLSKTPQYIQLRWMSLSEGSRDLLNEMAKIIYAKSTTPLAAAAPIDVARGLISLFDALEPWTKRTSELSKDAIRVREIFKLANDPNQFLFNDLPGLIGVNEAQIGPTESTALASLVSSALDELSSAYSNLMQNLANLLMTELSVPNFSDSSLQELRQRAATAKDIGGDFRLSAFVTRLSNFDGSIKDIEGIASLAANKPSRDWLDLDADRARLEIADLCEKFIKAENFARIKGRSADQVSFTLIVGEKGQPALLSKDFVIRKNEEQEIDRLVQTIQLALEGTTKPSNKLILAALSKIGAEMIREDVDQKQKSGGGTKNE